MNKNIKNAAQAGFTLIELIVVIVILGVLAATALPRFVNMGGDARLAALQGVRGGIASASGLAHAQALAQGMTAGNIMMEGQAIALVNGYPSAAAIVNAAGIQGVTIVTNADTGNTVGITTATSVGFLPSGIGATDPRAAACNVRYTEAVDANTPPVIAIGAANAAACQ